MCCLSSLKLNKHKTGRMIVCISSNGYLCHWTTCLCEEVADLLVRKLDIHVTHMDCTLHKFLLLQGEGWSPLNCSLGEGDAEQRFSKNCTVQVECSSCFLIGRILKKCKTVSSSKLTAYAMVGERSACFEVFYDYILCEAFIDTSHVNCAFSAPLKNSVRSLIKNTK